MDNLKDLESMHVALGEFRKIGKRNREILLSMLTKDHEELGDTVDSPFAAIKATYIKDGRLDKLQAIKAVRIASGTDVVTSYPKLGLKEAKELVESW